MKKTIVLLVCGLAVTTYASPQRELASPGKTRINAPANDAAKAQVAKPAEVAMKKITKKTVAKKKVAKKAVETAAKKNHRRYQVFLCGSLSIAKSQPPVGGPRFNVLYDEDGGRVVIQKIYPNPNVGSKFQRTWARGQFESDLTPELLDVFVSSDKEATYQVVLARDLNSDELIRVSIMLTDNSDFSADCK